MPSCTSPRVSASTLPISRVIARAIASLRSTSRSPTRCSTCPRIGAGVLDHWAKPRLADSIAFSMSAGPERGNRPITSFQSAGLRFSKYSPVEGATHSPAMKFLKVSAISDQTSAVGCDLRGRLGTEPDGLRAAVPDPGKHGGYRQHRAPEQDQQRKDVGEAH